MQDMGLLVDLRAALAEAQSFRMSKNFLFRARFLPVSQATIYRWLNGSVDPGLSRLTETIKALKEFIALERARVARGGKTLGGALHLDEEFFAAQRAGVTVRLKQQEFKVLAALRSTPRPAYFDWISQASGVSAASLPRAISELRRKLDDLDFEIVTIWGRGGEPSAYALSDRAATTRAAVTEAA